MYRLPGRCRCRYLNLRAYMRVGTFVGNTGIVQTVGQVANEDVSITAGFLTVLTHDLIFGAQFSIAGNGTAGLYVVANNGSGTTVRVVATLSNAPTEDANLRIDQNPVAGSTTCSVAKPSRTRTHGHSCMFTMRHSKLRSP